MSEWIIDFLVLSDIALMISVGHICGFCVNQWQKAQTFIKFRIVFSELNLAWILRRKATFCFLSAPISFCIDIPFGAPIVLWTLLLQSLLFALQPT